MYLDHALPLPNHGDNRTRGDEVNKTREEGFALS
jgi:hypothetical protein